MTRTVYMTNTNRGYEAPLFTFETNEELDWYVTWKLSCSTREYHAMMNCFRINKPFREEFHPNIQYEIRSGE